MDRIAVVKAKVPHRISLQRAALLRVFLAAQRVPLGTVASLKLSINQAKNLRLQSHELVDDLLSIRSRTVHGNSEFSAKLSQFGVANPLPSHIPCPC
jgi:hypothetical protein